MRPTKRILTGMGRNSNADTEFSRWLIEKGLTLQSVRDLVCATGHEVTVARIQQVAAGETPSVRLAKAIERAVKYPAKKLLGV